MIRFDNVTKVYRAAPRPALDGVSLEIDPGEFVFLVGASGSGKSSLLRLMLREEKPTIGEIHVLGQRLTSISNRKVPYFRRNLGVVFQDFRLLPNKSVFDNVAFTLQVIGKSKGFIQEAVPDVLRMVGLAEKSANLPNELSGGEQQRVAIARAVVNKPAILLADEPTGNLDPTTSAGIMQVLELINASGTTVVMATHDVSIVDRMKQRVVELVGGHIVRDEQHAKYVTTAIPVQDETDVDVDVEQIRRRPVWARSATGPIVVPPMRREDDDALVTGPIRTPAPVPQFAPAPPAEPLFAPDPPSYRPAQAPQPAQSPLRPAASTRPAWTAGVPVASEPTVAPPFPAATPHPTTAQQPAPPWTAQQPVTPTTAQQPAAPRSTGMPTGSQPVQPPRSTTQQHPVQPPRTASQPVAPAAAFRPQPRAGGPSAPSYPEPARSGTRTGSFEVPGADHLAPPAAYGPPAERPVEPRMQPAPPTRTEPVLAVLVGPDQPPTAPSVTGAIPAQVVPAGYEPRPATGAVPIWARASTGAIPVEPQLPPHGAPSGRTPNPGLADDDEWDARAGSPAAPPTGASPRMRAGTRFPTDFLDSAPQPTVAPTQQATQRPAAPRSAPFAPQPMPRFTPPGQPAAAQPPDADPAADDAASRRAGRHRVDLPEHLDFLSGLGLRDSGAAHDDEVGPSS